MEEQVADYFDEAQKSFANHKKAIRKLRRIYHQNTKDVSKVIFKFLKQIMVVFKREPSVERLVQFIVGFATESITDKDGNTDNNGEFCVKLLRKMLEFSLLKDKAVRFRSTQIIAGIINTLSPDCEIE